jgi:hypothetical protein
VSPDPAPAPTPTSTPAVEPLFLGSPDVAQRRALATEPIASVERGRGGRSLGFKITLADGTVGYFKPEQSFSAAHWYSELAAYYLDRALGFGRVPPAAGRRIAWRELRRAAGSDARIEELAIADDGTLRGVLVAWVPELSRLSLGRGWERWIRIDPPPRASPLVRPAEYRDAVNRDDEPAVAEEELAGEPDRADRPAELSDLLVFDYLIQNVDRWGGGNTNVRTSGRGGPLLFFDNGAGFWPNPRVPLMEARLQIVQRFQRSTIDALRRFDRAAFARSLATDALAPVLDAAQIDGIVTRRDVVLEHVRALEERFGERIYFESAP